MTRRYFGTDGVRGPYGGEVVNEIFAARLARAAVEFGKKKNPEMRRVVVGRDTRVSGGSLVTAILCDLAETTGLEIIDGGIAPTPAIAGAMEELEAGIGIVVTASHNPASDNGFKFFLSPGRKLTDAEELVIENLLDHACFAKLKGGFITEVDVAEMYRNRMRGHLSPGSLAGWRIVVDAANGATAGTTAQVLQALGAELVLIGHEPNGRNINDGVGSQHPEKLSKIVLENQARLGIAHDGDGDRVVLCDEKGTVLDGDDLLAILGTEALRTGQLNRNRLVATIQSNRGLDHAIEAAGGEVIRTEIGDRYVLDRMIRDRLNIGGESSGHVVLLDLSPTGDGLACALKVLQVMQNTGKPLSVLRQCWHRLPQCCKNIVVNQKPPLQDLKVLSEAIHHVEDRLGARGRVLVRYSGTEPMLRLLVEGEDPVEIDRLLARLHAAAVTEFGVN